VGEKVGEKERLQEYLGERYRTYLEELPNEEWVQAYKAFWGAFEQRGWAWG